jgi:hypothetical protein
MTLARSSSVEALLPVGHSGMSVVHVRSDAALESLRAFGKIASSTVPLRRLTALAIARLRSCPRQKLAPDVPEGPIPVVMSQSA